MDQRDALVAELATTPDVVDRLLAEHVTDDSLRSDRVIREILEAGDATALQELARELREIKTRDTAVAAVGRSDREVARRTADGRCLLALRAL